MTKKCWRLLPCAMYDLEKVESWLQDMAVQGWHQRQGRMVGRFEAGEPKNVRYRLQPKAKWYDSRTPDSDMVKLFQHMGWEFVTAHGDFYIFRTEDQEAPELNTEPKLMARSFRWMLWAWCFCGLLYGFLLLNSQGRLITEPYRYLVTFGPAFTVGFAGMMLSAVAVMVSRLIRVVGCYRRLKRAQELDHNKPWRQGATAFRAGTVFLELLWIAVFVMLIVQAAVPGRMTDVAEFSGEPKVVTMAQLHPEGEYKRNDWMDYYNKFREQENTVAYTLEWRENAQVMTPGGNVRSGVIIVKYYEVSTEWLAKGLARELERDVAKNKRYKPIELPELGLDDASGYCEVGYRVILRQGNVVIDAVLDEEFADLWLELTAKKLKK